MLYFFQGVLANSNDVTLETHFEDHLPVCGVDQNSRKNAAGKGIMKTNSLQNLSRPDSAMAFSGTADYPASDETFTSLFIQ